MGYNIRMLEEKHAEKGLDENHTSRLELEECIHFHESDLRLVWTTEQFLKLAEVFSAAKKKAEELGSPDSTEHMNMLANVTFDSPIMHEDRIAAEVTRDGSIHVHFKNLRIHMTPMDFYEFADGMRNALMSLNNYLMQVIDITAENIIRPSVVDEYLKVLDSHLAGDKVPTAEDVATLRYDMKWFERHPGCGDRGQVEEESLQRKSGNLPSPWQGPQPQDLSYRYLISLYGSIKKWGYASGPFAQDLMPAYQYPNGKIYLKGAHRSACLLKLGYSKIRVALAEAPTGWSVE